MRLMNIQEEKHATHAPKKSIEEVLHAYESALNNSDTEAVMQLYLSDGVFMPQQFESAVGEAAIKTAYENVFKAIQLTVKFAIKEIVEIAPNWAFARTISSGSAKIHATAAVSKESNQELFLFSRGTDGSWKIARYCFCVTI